MLMGQEAEAEADFARFHELAPDMDACLTRVIDWLRAHFAALGASVSP
jgi:hypothetical protein